MQRSGRFLFASLLALTASSVLVGCGGSSSSDANNVSFDAAPMIQHLGNDVILQTYKNLNTAAANLQTASAAMVDDTITEQELDDAQAAWKQVRVYWEASEGFLFGPVDAQGIDPAIDTWPLNTSDLQAFLSTGTKTPADIRAAQDNVKGFHAIEFLLFGDGVSSNDQQAADIDASELAYLDSLIQVLHENTDALETAWTTQYDTGNPASGPYIDQFTQPGTTSLYASQSAAVEELVSGVIAIIDEVGNGKLAEPFGTSLANADTTKVESQYSWNSLTDFHNNVRSVLHIYTGELDFDLQNDTPNPIKNGLMAFVFAHDSALAQQVFDEIKAAMDAIALIDGDDDVSTTDITNNSTQKPFHNAIKEPSLRDEIQTAIDALAELQVTLQSKVQPLISRTNFSL